MHYTREWVCTAYFMGLYLQKTQVETQRKLASFPNFYFIWCICSHYIMFSMFFGIFAFIRQDDIYRERTGKSLLNQHPTAMFRISGRDRFNNLWHTVERYFNMAYISEKTESMKQEEEPENCIFHFSFYSFNLSLKPASNTNTSTNQSLVFLWCFSPLFSIHWNSCLKLIGSENSEEIVLAPTVPSSLEMASNSFAVMVPCRVITEPNDSEMLADRTVPALHLV